MQSKSRDGSFFCDVLYGVRSACLFLIYVMMVSFSPKEYRILGKKGEGTFSEVLKVQDVRDGNYFACKKMKQRYER